MKNLQADKDLRATLKNVYYDLANISTPRLVRDITVENILSLIPNMRTYSISSQTPDRLSIPGQAELIGNNPLPCHTNPFYEKNIRDTEKILSKRSAVIKSDINKRNTLLALSGSVLCIVHKVTQRLSNALFMGISTLR